MRPFFYSCLALCVGLLLGCTPDTAPLNPTAELDFRSSDDCQSYDELQTTSGTCEDFSNCADLAGRRPIRFSLGAPPITTTGQSDGPDQFGITLCSDPAAGHPFSFSFNDLIDLGGEVQAGQYLGRLQVSESSACVRFFLDPEITGPIPFPIPGLYTPPADPADFPYDLYPACNDILGTYSFVAANGDRFTIEVEADGFPDCDNPDLCQLVGQWQVIGGTGRFDDATGGGCVTGSGPANPFAPNPVARDIWHLEGGIDF